jgi:hypothetical protein
MASDTDVANFALTLLGAARITSLADNNKSARSVSAVIDMLRRAELEKRFWSFAIKRESLPALSDAPTYGYAYAYQLPSDFLRMIQVGENYESPSLTDYRTIDDSPYSIEAGTIATDYGSPLNIRYVRDVTDYGLFNPLFCTALAAQVAFTCCEEITNSNSKRDAMVAAYKQSIKDAVSVNAVQRSPQGIADDSWIIGRL